MKRLLRNILVALGLTLVVVFTLIGFLSVTRGTPVSHVRAPGDKDGPPSPADSMFIPTLELLTQMHLAAGNNIEIFTNGNETYPAMWRDLRSAKRSITLQMYYAQPGKVADTLRSILIERVKAGVRILFLNDAFGSQNLKEDYWQSLREAGIRVSMFRPVKWYDLDKANARSHIRVVVVDGSVAYTGGFGIDDKWLGDGRHKDQWRDTNVRFRGPAVMALQATFIEGWVEATGELMTGDLFFPPKELKHDGTQLATLLHTAPTTGSTAAERYLALSIASARKTLYISNSYFVPDDDFRRLLKAAAQRHVDVRILTTSKETDVKTTWRAGRAHYEELLGAGVRVYEYQPVMMHAKSLVVDGLWGGVGTMNFDNRSLVFNDESMLVALDRRYGAQLDSIFFEDIKYAKEIKLAEFSKRSWGQRVVERAAVLLSRVL
ncbi:MAG TPA: phospholipase D-like domain-containing protein [Gemmatimonadaceae bacterium]|nr:phospholipase D-like domain-containing protein [Gemmatimonadaceae bacterium]